MISVSSNKTDTIQMKLYTSTHALCFNICNFKAIIVQKK